MKTNRIQLTILGLLVLGVVSAALKTPVFAKASGGTKIIIIGTSSGTSVSNP